MLITIPLAEYTEILRSPLRGEAFLHKHYAAGMHMLVTRWASQVTAHQLAVLMFVFDRTFYYGKMSETVVFDQFLGGMVRSDRDEMVFCGLNISMPTLLKTLKELAFDDFLHVRACENPSGKGEVRPRLYAINCKKLFNLDIADAKNPMILREPKQKKTQSSDEFDAPTVTVRAVSGLKQPRAPRQDSGATPPKLFEGIYSDRDTTKVVVVGAASPAEPQPAIDPFARLDAIRQQREQARAARGTRPTRRSAASSAPTSQVNVQAMLDTAMRTYQPSLPRVMVAAKPLGVLKKRITAAEIDIAGFIDWAIKFWQTTATQHERAARRRTGETQTYTHKPLPSAPDFNTLCYQFPYFLACYRSHLAAASAGLATTKEEQLQQKVEKLQRTVEYVRDEARSAMTRERNMRQKMRAAPAPEEASVRTARITRPARSAPTVLDDNGDIPTWDDLPAPRKARP